MMLFIFNKKPHSFGKRLCNKSTKSHRVERSGHLEDQSGTIYFKFDFHFSDILWHYYALLYE